MANTETTKEVTVTVAGYWGTDKQCTKEDFIKQWVVSVSDLYSIAVDRKDRETVRVIREDVRAMAGRRWDELLEMQKG